ncbi:flagellin N-terminal helical domain-containing protein [Lysinibacillus capsici]|uniref:flagellin N-terminal helical domain-containing protein n=1 Tax=Lysinibacillus capsici TaxID=2115968 RepID=UPI0030820243|nr:flagellin [Lysinibacillus capsici]
MRIQHNISALNTHRNLAFNNTQTSKALEKLSSGYKINRAGDDAAGLAISEKMRGQIRGLDMASKNAQDGISLIQTAEGALNETHSILQRMRELAVQAGNDTNTTTDREEIQKEINQLTSEINRIGNTTEFNTKKLVNGDLSDKFVTKAATTTSAGTITRNLAQNGTVQVGADPVSWTGTSKADIDVKIGATTDNGTDFAKLATSVGNTIKITRDGDNFKVDIDVTSIDAGTTAGTTVSAAQVSFTASTGKYSYNSQGVSFEFTAEDAAKWADGESVTINLSTLAGAGKDVSNKTQSTVANKQDFTTNMDSNGTAASITGGITVSNSKFADLGQVKIEQNTGTSSAKVTLQTASGAKLAEYNFSLTAGATLNFNADGVKFDFKGAEVGTSAVTTVDGTFKLNTKSVTEETAPSVATPAETDDRSLKFQIGANKDQAIAVSLGDMRAKALGITTTGTDEKFGVTDGTDSTITEQALDITSHENAAKAVKTLDDAIAKVSSERSKLGAVQNRLEHTINNLGTSSENLTAAESRIRDTDMAASMMEFTKNNILTQAAQSMLAQANQQPQGVLQLLG